MPIWIVDDGPLNTLSMVVAPASATAWPTGEFMVADVTARDATGSRKALLDEPGTPFTVFSVAMGTRAADILYTPAASSRTSAGGPAGASSAPSLSGARVGEKRRWRFRTMRAAPFGSQLIFTHTGESVTFGGSSGGADVMYLKSGATAGALPGAPARCVEL